LPDFLMPVLGADMDEGTVVEWLVKPGDQIRKGDIIAVIDTSKSAIEVESFHTGTVQRLVVAPGETVPVGTVLAVIGEPATETAPQAGKTAPQAVETAPRPAEPHPADASSPLIRHLARDLGVDLTRVTGTGRAGTITRADVQRAAAARPPVPAPSGRKRREAAPHAAPRRAAPRAARQRVSPRARRVAGQLGVEVAGLTGSGPGGAVREADVRKAAALPRTAAQQPPPAPEQDGAAAVTRAADRTQAMRLAIGRLMARSKREVPHYYLSNTVDMTAAMSWLHQRNRELAVSERLVPAALLLKATAAAARQVPDLNGYWQDDHFVPGTAVHLGVPISLRGGGLLTPAIHDAADLAPSELMARLRDLATRARSGRLRRAELTEATITVTNLGDQGVEAVFGVIFPPQVALVGIGKVTEKPVAVNGLIGARPTVITTLSADHRASDGYTGARFLAVLSDLLQRPEEL
jgi:pyruvate dehydrogenase E2 component (dihydrolipoamide acetyltransferase)